MKKSLALALLLCAAASPGSCGGAGSGGPGAAINPGTPLDVPFGTYKIVAKRADRFFSKLDPEPVVYADALLAALDAGDAVFVADVRDTETFGKGHVPTAVNLPLAALFTEASLVQLPVDGTPIVVVSKDGHAAALAAGALGTLGYDARPLAFGMIGWSSQTSVPIGSATGAPQRIFGIGGRLE